MVQEEIRSSRKLNAWLSLLLVCMLVIGMLVGTKLPPVSAKVTISNNNTKSSATATGENNIEELIRYIEVWYVDDIDRDVLIQETINEILSKPNLHSNYIPSEELPTVKESLEKEFKEIGIELNKKLIN